MMKIASLTIQNMHNVQQRRYTFQDINYLIGANGAGKSTVLQAIQLALLGYVPGMKKTNDAIFQHCNSNMMSVTLEMRDKNAELYSIRRSWMKTSKGINSDVVVTPTGLNIEALVANVELPVFNFSEFMSMTANKLKDWFIAFMPKSETTIDWLTELKDCTADLVEDSQKYIDMIWKDLNLEFDANPNESSVDQVRRVNTWFKQKQSFLKSDIERLNNTVQSLVYYDDTDMSVPVEEINSEIANINALIAEVQRYESETAALKYRKEQFEQIDQYLCDDMSADKNLQMYQETSRDLTKLIHASNDNATKLTDEIYKLQVQSTALQSDCKHRVSIISSGGVCPYLSEKCEQITSTFASLEQQNNDDQKRVANICNEIDTLKAERNRIESELKENQEKLREVTNKITELQNNYLQRDSEKAKLDVLTSKIVKPSTDRTVEQLQQQLSELTTRSINIAANNRYNQLIDKITQEQFTETQLLEYVKRWVKLTDANNLQTKLATEPFIRLAANITQTLKAMMNDTTAEVSFKLSSAANSFSIGITRGEQYIPFELLSSGERCIFSIALLITILKQTSSDIKVLMVDDLLDHLDDTNAQKLFAALKDKAFNDIQFIFAGVKPCDTPDIVVEITT